MTTRRVFVRVGGRGSPLRASRRFPLDALPSEIRAWREQARTELRAQQPVPRSGFAKDAALYLAAITAMPSYRDRARDIGLWVAEFGDRPRATITAVEIRAIRDRWLTVGPRHVQHWVTDAATGKRLRRDTLVAEPLRPATVNHRLRALENLYTVLDGRHAPNPVRAVPEVAEDEGPIRAIPPALIRAILAELGDSPTKARLRVMAATGLPHATLGRLDAVDFDPVAKTLWVPGRRKGHGTRGRLMPLTSTAVAALKALAAWDAWGPFSRSALRKAWLRACRKAGVTVPLRVYDLRHSHAVLTLGATRDLRATQILLGHSTPRLTERYARAAVDPVLAAAAAKVDAAQKKRR